MWFKLYSILIFLVFLNFSTCDVYRTYKDEGILPSKSVGRKDPEALMTMEEVVQHHGYTVENFDVQTLDGYIITIQHIPCGKVGSCNEPRKPVIVQHGLLCNAACWVINTPEKNLAYLLAEGGYDVWLSNVRGTKLGRKHLTMNATSKEYWDFDWDQMAKYDMPASIDFILNKTGYGELLYIGHSMGTTIAFAMLSSKPEYNYKVKAVIALAPVVTTGHIRSPIRLLAPSSPLLCSIGEGELLPYNQFTNWVASQTCGMVAVEGVCTYALFLFLGSDYNQFNQTRLPVYLHFLPAGTSVRTLVHFAQMVESKKFLQFDHGQSKNMGIYGQANPPEYNLTNVLTPVALFWSDNDYLSDPIDVSLLADKLPNVFVNHRVRHTKFAHLDFLWAIDVKPLLYDKVLSVMSDLWVDKNTD